MTRECESLAGILSGVLAAAMVIALTLMAFTALQPPISPGPRPEVQIPASSLSAPDAVSNTG